MPLDKNFFSLVVRPRPDDATQIELRSDAEVLDGGSIHYLVKLVENAIVLIDPLSEVALGELRQDTPKSRQVNLFSPDSTINLVNSGYFSWQWTCTFEDHGLVWKRVSHLTTSERAFELSTASASYSFPYLADNAVQDSKNDTQIALMRYQPASSKRPSAVEFYDHNIAVRVKLHQQQRLGRIDFLGSGFIQLSRTGKDSKSATC